MQLVSVPFLGVHLRSTHKISPRNGCFGVGPVLPVFFQADEFNFTQLGPDDPGLLLLAVLGCFEAS